MSCVVSDGTAAGRNCWPGKRDDGCFTEQDQIQKLADDAPSMQAAGKIAEDSLEGGRMQYEEICFCSTDLCNGEFLSRQPNF